jgi:hypothetical protein
MEWIKAEDLEVSELCRRGENTHHVDFTSDRPSS